MKIVWHDTNYTLEYEGESWNIEVKEWRDGEDAKLYIYRINGDITSHNLKNALQSLADTRSCNFTCSII